MGWDYFLNQADADAYFTSERLETASWDALTPAEREKAVTFAYNRMFYDPTYSLPTLANASASQLVVLRKATGELAYYVAMHLDDEDRRKGIQAQGTIEAGIVQEKYWSEMMMSLPYPPIVLMWLQPFKADQPIFKTDIDRDEDESVDENVTDFS